MVRSIEEIKADIQARIGDDDSDEALALMENLADTLADLENKANSDGENWKAKYEENDKNWRKRYKERFTNPGKSDKDDSEIIEDEDEKLTYENLFKEEK